VCWLCGSAAIIVCARILTCERVALQDYKSSRKSWGIDALGSIIVEVELAVGGFSSLLFTPLFTPLPTPVYSWLGLPYCCAFERVTVPLPRHAAQNGIVGVGVSIGGEPACYIVEQHLSRFVEGQVRCLRLRPLAPPSLPPFLSCTASLCVLRRTAGMWS
jgi:hypothetical protein